MWMGGAELYSFAGLQYISVPVNIFFLVFNNVL